MPGRFELVSDARRPRVAVVVDYAHTPDGLVEVLGAARAVAARRRVIVVFGCGGDRDADKRPLMGAAAGRARRPGRSSRPTTRATRIPTASSMPPSAGVDRGTVTAVRSSSPTAVRAIALALALAETGDVVVIAGKGHETTQTIGDTAVPFDDRRWRANCSPTPADGTETE